MEGRAERGEKEGNHPHSGRKERRRQGREGDREEERK